MGKYILKIFLLFSLAVFSQSPGAISSGLVRWLKADSGISPATNGIAITQWDSSVGTLHATQAGSSGFPTYVESFHNFNPSVYVPDGDTGYFELDLDIINDSDYNIIAIVERDATEPSSYVLGTAATSVDQGLHFGYRTNNSVTLAQYGNDVTLTGLNSFDDPKESISLIRGQLDSSTGKIIQELRNGVFKRKSHSRKAFLTGNNQGTVGRGFGVNTGFNGYISEVIVYNSTLSDADLAKIYSYLAIKYGMTLDSSDGITNGNYENSNGDLLWDASANATYHHEVISIGKDDASDLNQLKSIDPSGFLTLDKTTSFSTDLDFISVGHDDNPLTLSPNNVPSGIISKSQRTWKVSTNGTPGSVSISFELGEDIANSTIPSDYEILIDNDTDFSNASKHTAGAVIVGNTLTFTNVSLSNGAFFTLGINSLTSAPGFITSGIVSWFKADVGTAPTVNGTAITQWSNNVASTHATQAGSSNFPTYQDNIHNYNPSVYFANGDNGYFDVNLDAINNSNYNVIAIVKRDNNNGDSYFLGTTSGVSDNGFHFGYSVDGTAKLSHVSNDLDLSVNNYDSPTTSTVLLRGQLDNGSGKIIQELRDGSLKEATDTSTDFLTGDNLGVIGRGFNSNGFEGYVSEIIAYSSTLTDVELTRIYSYLAIKYGLTLDQTDGITNGNYQNTDGITIWDATSNSVYHHEIIGIGRDDKSVLEQLKSTEPETSSISLTIEASSGFSTDKSFMIIGNDDGTEGTITSGIHANYSERVERTWKVQKTGTLGLVDINFTIGGAIANTGNPHDYAILIDTDIDFSDATLHDTKVSLDGNVLTFKDVDLSDGDIFTLGVGSNIAGPGDVIGNLQLWFKANSGIVTTINGSAVNQWDNNVNSSHAIQVGASNLPTYQENTHNFNPSVYFEDGRNGYFEIDLDVINDSDYNLIAIVEREADNANNYYLGTQATSTNNALHLGYRSNNVLAFAQYANDINMGVNDFDDPAPSRALIRAQLDSSVGRVVQELRDGSLTRRSTSNTAFLTGNNQGTLGRGFGVNTGFQGNISEVIVYSRTLSDADLIKIYSYLSIKYGMTLDMTDGITNGNYQDSAGNVIWDASANSDYHKNITVIGNDITSQLSQKQSKSENTNAILTMALGNTIETLNVDNMNTFDDDLDFLAIGSKYTSEEFEVICDESGLKLNRDWKVKNSGNVGSVTLQFDMTDISSLGDFDLLIDTDGDFSDTLNQTINTSGIPSGNNLTFSGITLSDGAVFTLVKTSASTIVYNGSWSGGSNAGVPDVTDGDKRVVVESNVTLTESFDCSCLKIDSGVVLTVEDNQYVSANELILNGDLYLEGDAELIQTQEDKNNNGSGNVYKIINDATESRYIYNYFSSPVNTSGTFTIGSNLKFNTGATLADNTDPTFNKVSNEGDSSGNTLVTKWMHTMNNALAFTEIDDTETMDPGVGFTMKGTGGTDTNYNFIGSPNTGTISVPLTAGNFLLTGNPYPSTIDAGAFNDANISTNGGATEGVIYLWDQANTGITTHSQNSGDESGGYATITGNISVASATYLDGTTPVTGATTPDNFIRPGQGFLVYGDATGNVEFTNALRATSNDRTAHFFSTNSLTTINPLLRLGFEFTNSSNITYHRQIASSLSGGTMDKEIGKDAFMFDYNANDMYWVLPNEVDRFVITDVPYITDDLELPLGVVVDQEREVTFKIDEVKDLDSSVYLLDKETQSLVNLSSGDYSLILDSGDYQDRFSIVFGEQVTLSNDEFSTTKVILGIENEKLSITLENDFEIQNIEIYSISGTNVLSSELSESKNNAVLNIASLSNQVYVARLTTNKGLITKKFIIK